MSDTDHNTHNTNQHALTCMEIWGGNQAFDNAVSVPGIDAWVFSKPYGTEQTGGDVHYVSMCGCGEIGRFFLADLSGHGENASQPAADVRRLMRKYINTLDQTDFVRSLNDRMMEWKQQGRFATTLLSTYFAPTKQMLICNAGHPAPLWYRAATREWRWLQQETSGQSAAADNLPVGIVEGTEYIQFVVELKKDDRVLIYSDSLYESRDQSGDQLGREGLLRLMNELADLPPDEQARELVGRIMIYHGSQDLEDDLTIMLLHHHGEGQVEKTMGERLRTMGRMLGLLRV
jgi:phosphoserine phosphatase RsbU/P